MKRSLILGLLLSLTACSTTVPVKRTFPEVPRELLIKCPELKEVPEGTEKLSELLSVVADNYGQYKECQLSVELWNEWYREQKKIFDSVK